MSQLPLFFATCLALSALPGPNNVLCLTHAVQSGKGAAVLGMLGRFPAYVIMIIVAGLIFTSAVALSDGVFDTLRLLGSLYMIFLGFQITRFSGQSAEQEPGIVGRYFTSEFMTALSNPKAIIVFVALFPNFISATDSIVTQFFILGLIAMSAEAMMALVYVMAGSFFGARNIPTILISRVAGGIIVVAALRIIYTVMEARF